MKTSALDLGTRTGWALLDGTTIIESGTLVLATDAELRQQRKEGKERTLDIRFVRLLAFIVQQLQAGVRRIVFEDVEFAKTTAQAQLWASLRSAIWAAALNSPVEICGVQVNTLKLYATGVGGANKTGMAKSLAAVAPELYRLTEDLDIVRADGTLIDDNEVDAIWLARFTMAVDRGEAAFLSGFERKVARKQEKRAKKAARKAKRKARKQAAIIAARAKRQARLAKAKEARSRRQASSLAPPVARAPSYQADTVAPSAGSVSISAGLS